MLLMLPLTRNTLDLVVRRVEREKMKRRRSPSLMFLMMKIVMKKMRKRMSENKKVVKRISKVC